MTMDFIASMDSVKIYLNKCLKLIRKELPASKILAKVEGEGRISRNTIESSYNSLIKTTLKA